MRNKLAFISTILVIAVMMVPSLAYSQVPNPAPPPPSNTLATMYCKSLGKNYTYGVVLFPGGPTSCQPGEDQYNNVPFPDGYTYTVCCGY